MYFEHYVQACELYSPSLWLAGGIICVYMYYNCGVVVSHTLYFQCLLSTTRVAALTVIVLHMLAKLRDGNVCLLL